jgi:hypothetical protein
MVHLLAERFVLCALFFGTLPAESSVCELFSRISSQVALSSFCEVFMSKFNRFITNSSCSWCFVSAVIMALPSCR